jgi:hypothetical protein
MKRVKKELIDPEVNGKFHHSIELCLQRDHGKKTLRVNRNTIILVKPEKCNQTYAKEYIEKIEHNSPEFLKTKKIMIDKIKIAALKKAHDTNLVSPSQQHFFNDGVDQAIKLDESELESKFQNEVIPTMLDLIKYCHTRWMSGPVIPNEMCEQIFDDFLHKES